MLAEAWKRFWFDFEVTRPQVAIYRVVFFLTVAFDAFTRIEYTARAGLCGFNVAHLGFLDALWTPTPLLMRVLLLAQMYLAVMMALGEGNRRTMVALTALHGFIYFSSITDAFAHHYLVFLLLFLGSFADWRQPEKTAWVFRLIMVQYGIVYFWAAVGKVNPYWASGDLLFSQPLPQWLRLGVFHVTQFLKLDLVGTWAFIAQSVVIGEFLLAAGLISMRARWLVCLAGMGLHVFIFTLKLDIGQFVLVMLSAYALALPDGWRAALLRILAPLKGVIPADRPTDSRLLAGVFVLLTAASVLAVPMPGMAVVAVMFVLLLVVPDAPGVLRNRRVLVHGLTCALVLVFSRTTVVVPRTLQLAAVEQDDCGDRNRSREMMDEAVALFPNDIRGLLIRGQMHDADGDLHSAYRLYARARELAPSDENVASYAQSAWERLENQQ